MSGGLARRADAVMAGACGIWFAWMLYLALHRLHGLGHGAFDLGIFDQGLWLLANGHEPFVTLRGLHLLGDHASYLVYLMVPLYWIWDDVRLLVILTTLLPAVGGWLSYRIARVEGLAPWPSVLVGAAVLLMPAMLWTPWDAFHPETFAIVLLPASYLAARRGRFTLALVLGALVLLAKEDSGLTVAPYALYWWWRWREARPHAYVLAFLAVGISALSLLVVLPGHSPTGELIYTGRYTGVELLTLSRLWYLAATLLPALPALWAPRFLVLGLPITVANLITRHFYQHDIKWHYTAYLLGVLAVGVPLGASRWLARRQGRLAMQKLAAALAVTIAMTIVAGPDLITRTGLWGGINDRERAELEAVIAAVPPDASVTATWSLVPFLAHRPEIYTSPNPFEERYWGAGGEPPLPDPATVEYLAVDVRNLEQPEDPVAAALETDAYDIVAGGETFVLARRR